MRKLDVFLPTITNRYLDKDFMDDNSYMRNNFYKISLSFMFTCVVAFASYAQVTVPPYNACPNQTVPITATWNNVSNISYTLANSSGLPPYLATSGVTNTFIISSPTSTNFILYASGTQGGSPVTSSVSFNLIVTPPAAMTITNVGQYCYGSTATFIAPVGGGQYTVSGPPGTANMVSNSNIITIPNVLPAPNNGNYTITSVFSGCTNTGVTTMAVAPNVGLTISSATNICLGGSYCFTSSLAGGDNVYNWTGPNSFGAVGQTTCVVFNSLNQNGVYYVNSNQVFGNITCPKQASTTISVVQTSPPSISASPAHTLCQGANLNLSSGAGNAIGFSWNGPQNFSSSLQSPVLTNIVPNMAGSYSVTALFTNGVITCTTGAAVTVSIVATAQPIIYATTDVCEGPLSIINFSVSTNPSALTYTWSGPGNPPWTIIQTAQQPPPYIAPVLASHSGVYYVYAKFQIGSTQCITSKSVQVNVVPVSTVAVIPPGAVCQPNNAYLQASAVGAYQFSWAGPNGYSSSLPNSTVYYPTPSASGIYTVTAIFYNGVIYCSNTNTVSLTVNPLLNFTLTPVQQVCYNKPLHVNGPSGATSYSWTSSNGFTSNSQNINFTSIQPNQAGSYTLNVSLGPCITTQTTLIGVISPIQFTLTPPDRIICRGDTTLLSAGASGGTENYYYNWNPSIYLPSPTGGTQVCVPLGTTIYNISAHDNLCPEYTISHSFTVMVNQPPLPDLRLEKVESCQPLCLFLNSRTQSESSIITYDFGGFSKMQRDSFEYCIDEPGTYNLKIYSKGKNGCFGQYDYPYPIVVNPKPNAKISWVPEYPTVTDEVTLSPDSKYEASQYTWMFTGISELESDTTNLKNPKILFESTGSYPIVLVSKTDKECSDTILKFIDIRDDYNIYVPNAFTPNDDGLNDIFQIKATGVSLNGFTMDIFDRWGNSVYSSRDITLGWDGKVGGKKSNDGIYTYKIKIIGANAEGLKEFTGRFTLIK